MASPGIALLKQGVKPWNEWRKSKDGSPDLSGADLRNCDLTGADLRGANLSNAILRGAKLGQGTLLWNANFSGADLYQANLRGADLQDVNFSGADLFQADLRESNLQGADLSSAKGGLLSKQLAGSDLTGAKLPEPLAKLYDGLSQVKEISDSAQKLFLALLVGCLYSWLTIAQTTDVELITDRGTTPLPIIQAAIPIVGFYVVAPLILLCLYFYFHFYLQKLWEELGSLPAVFTDGLELHKRTDPWLLNDLVRSHFVKLRDGRPFLSYFQAWVSVVLAWWLVPVTLFMFWGRYLRRHDPFWSVFHALLLTTSIIAAIRLYHLANRTLRGHERTVFVLGKIVKHPRPHLHVLLAAILGAFFVAVSYGAIFGEAQKNGIVVELLGIKSDPRTWVPSVMSSFGYSPFANLTNVDVSIKPPNWTGKKDDELDLVKGATLDGSDLRHAEARNAFFVKANLSKSHMEGAQLYLADLRRANLELAHLEDAFLVRALLQDADMNKAHMENALLIDALLDRADLQVAHLERARLHGASLTDAYMGLADLDHADLTHAKLQRAHLNGANFRGVLLYSSDMTGADLTQADLSNANLQGAGLEGVDMCGSDLTGANLSSASIKYANLRDCGNIGAIKGLTLEMIVQAKNWQLAFYNSDMLKQLGLPPDHNEKLQKQMEAEQQAQAAADKSSAPKPAQPARNNQPSRNR